MPAYTRMGYFKGKPRPGIPIAAGNQYAIKVNEKSKGKVVVDVLAPTTSYKLVYKTRAKFEEDWE